MHARIYQPSKTAMQSGKGKTKQWLLEFEPKAGSRKIDPLMGWTSSSDTTGQIRMAFDSRDAAIEFAKREGLTFSVEEARDVKRLVKSYSANFSADRKQPWTH